MGQLFIVLAVALVAAALVFGITVLIMGGDQGLEPIEPDGRSVPLPGSRPLTESDLGQVRFDVTLRGYRMTQVDLALRRAAYDLGYKEELIGVLEAEVAALRAGRVEEADALRDAREQAARPTRMGDDAGLTGAEATGAEAGSDRALTVTAADPGQTVTSDLAEDAAQPADSAADPKAADPKDAGDGDDSPAGDGDQDGRRWPTGFGKMSDPAAAEPAK
ncbi:DivIVA domain-containing protein [Rugosimonospora africana]|nr:DivIVA domain-containing protein [Rugosimonospora africana]